MNKLESKKESLEVNQKDQEQYMSNIIEKAKAIEQRLV